MVKRLRVSKLNENLKPIMNDDGEKLPIEISLEKIRISNELDVNGDLLVTGGTLKIVGGESHNPMMATGAAVSIESSNDIVLKSTSTQGFISLYHQSDKIIDFAGGPNTAQIRMYAEDTTDGTINFASINTGANGAIEFANESFSAADFTLDFTGEFIIENMDMVVTATHKILFDGSKTGHTYITESSDDTLDFYVGGIKMLHLDEANSDIEILADEVNLADEDGTTYTGDANASVQTKAQIDTAIDTAKVIYSTEVSINALQMGNLHSTEQILVAAPGSDKVVIPTSVTCFVDRNASTAQANGLCDAFVAWNGATDLSAVCFYMRRFMYNESGDRILNLTRYGHEMSQSTGDGDNRPLTIKLDSAITTGSIDAMKVVTTYFVYDNS